MVWNPSNFKILEVLFTEDMNGSKQIHYNETFSEVKALLNIWIKRLSIPLGRVAILKSLEVPTPVH